MHTSIRAVIAALFLLFLATGALAAAVESVGTGKLTLAVVPRLPPSDTHRDWSPFVERIQRMTGLQIELRVFRTFAEFEGFVFGGSADLAFINPYQQLELRKTAKFIPLVRDSSRSLNGVLVVRADSAIKSVADLNGKEIAFPHPNAFGASLHMRALLQEEFHITFKPLYVESHGNVFRHVLLGKAVAGGGVNVTLSKEPEALRSQMRVLFESPGVAPHPLSAHPRVPQPLREKFARAILDMTGDAAGRAMLATVTLTQPVRAEYDLDYKPLEKLHLEKYYVHTDVPEQ